MYTAGNYADHVTRYNHKPNRWMPDATPQQPRTLETVSVCICTGCIAVLIAIGVMLLQM
jgi:hypothetical protein